MVSVGGGELHAVPLLSMPGVVLLPGTLMPLHAFEPAACRVLSAALADRRLVVVAPHALASSPRPYTGLHAPGLCALARIVSDRRYPDGRVDAFVHGLDRARITHVHEAASGHVVSLVAEADTAYRGDAGRRLRQVAQGLVRVLAEVRRAEEAEALRAILASTSDPGVLANRLGAAFIEAPDERQALLEARCPGVRAEWLTRRLGEVFLDATPSARVGH